MDNNLELLDEGIAKLKVFGGLTESDWLLIDQSLADLLWYLAGEKIGRLQKPEVVIELERGKRRRKRCRAARIRKAIAGSILRSAVARGSIRKPKQCQRCKKESTAPLHGHHEDYDKPLDVLWLCAECHVNEHRGEIGTVHKIRAATPIRKRIGLSGGTSA